MSTAIYCCQQVSHKSCVERHNLPDAVVDMFILKTLTIQMDKIGSQLPNELPHWQIALTALNYSVNKYVLPSRSLPSISSTTLVVDGFAVDCSFISNGGIQTNKSKSPSAARAASTPQRTYEVYSIVGSVSARRFDRALKLSRPSFPSRAIGQKAGRLGTPKS